MSWRGFFLLCCCGPSAVFAAEVFCYDMPGEVPVAEQVQVKGQRVDGQHTARIAGWVLDVLPDAVFVNQPWQRCLHHARHGRVTGLLSLGWTAERGGWYSFPLRGNQPDTTMALYDVPYNIFVHRDSKVQWDGQRFAGLNYGLVTFKGYLAEQRLRELNALTPLQTDINQAVDLVSKGRLDGYVMPPGAMDRMFRQQPGFAKLKQLEKPLFAMPLYLAFYPGYCQSKASTCQQVWQHLAAKKAQWQQQQATDTVQ
jgi:polar amino acid transport system substrate-binding protein